MPCLREEFKHVLLQTTRYILQRATPEQRLARLSLGQRLASLTPEQILATLPREELENYLKHLPPSAKETPPEPPQRQP